MPEEIQKPGGDIMEPGITPTTPQFKEIVASAAPVVWIKKKPGEIRKFPIFNQGDSGSCVAQTGKKLLGVYVQDKGGAFVALSASHIYQRRSNKPGSGMIGINCFEIMEQGTTLSVLAPDENMHDEQMDAVKVSDFDIHVGEPFKSGKPIVLPVGDIDAIASVIQATGKAVMVWFYFRSFEWTAHPTIQDTTLSLTGPLTLRHSVAAVDFTLTEDGKKALIIDDSWGPSAGNGAGQRTIDEDFFKKRNWFAAYFMNFAYEEAAPTPIPSPIHQFNRVLEFIPLDAQGNISDPVKNDIQHDDVVALQDILKRDGVFPVNVSSTGYYGAVTKKSVQDYQLKHLIAPATDPGFGRVGPKTRAYLNSHQ